MGFEIVFSLAFDLEIIGVDLVLNLNFFGFGLVCNFFALVLALMGLTFSP